MVRHRTLVVNVVGLSGRLLRTAPELSRLAAAGKSVPLRTVTPAVTCSVQATMLTGAPVAEHGVVGNGWYHRETAEVRFWCQSNALIHGEQIWHAAKRRDPDFRGANLFWWFNMYSPADIGVTPRPMYPADGRKIPDVYTHPAALRERLNASLGTFPLFQFWGPGASIVSSNWIAACTREVLRNDQPDLAMVYLPPLDYEAQRFGPMPPKPP
ncbi:MAG: alkaline phosphatase family protein, partial [Myxococcales bacterium FL481]